MNIKESKPVVKLTLSAMFMAIGLVLPFFTGQIPQIGKLLLPMHIPVFLCGLICGWQYGLGVGFALPLIRSLLIGMPKLFPTAAAMAFELAVYGLVVGILYWRSHRQNIISLYCSMILAMIAGRVVWGIAVEKEGDKFVKTVNSRICGCVDPLFKICYAQKIGRGVQRTAANIHIRRSDICSVSMTAAQGQENDPAFQMFVFTKKIVFRTHE